MTNYGGIYKHRGMWIFKYHNGKGWYIEGQLDIFATLSDVKDGINKYLDGTNKKEPVIIGQWQD